MKSTLALSLALCFATFCGCGDTQMQIPLERITEQQRDRYLEVGGINGSELNGVIMDETDEYDDCVAVMIATLEHYGKLGIDRDCPYYVNRYAPADYFPCVEVKGAEHVTLKLITELHANVVEMPPKYRIDVCSAFPFWTDELNVFIERGKIYWYADDTTAANIGLLDASTLPVGG
ncbi:hypothetical protein NHH03_24610 [Stieleria sp. TO1_6]|uniref:hypothetical protein n=1 Tax=Stieleria tagensis TaxID=2956795 RepID=UPI00209B5276|nr:hypothetical protein [Stieleria tagensis]MCO8124943.1 hypothetical protein [Stieleria tagensis]